MVICPLCGFEFDATDALCNHGCPLNSFCTLVRCPSCEYEFPREPEGVRGFWSRLFGRRPPSPSETRSVFGPGEIATLRDLPSGGSGRVVALGGDDGHRHNSLAVFGLVPGAEVVLLQRRPAFVVRVGETELALDAEIAGEIVVSPDSPSRPDEVSAPA